MLRNPGKRKLIRAGCGSGCRWRDHSRGILFGFDPFVRQVRLKTASAPRFVHACGPHDDQVFRSHQPLRMHGRISALHANGEQLDDLFGNGQQARHRLEGTPKVISVEAGDDHPLSHISHAHADVDQTFSEELALVNPHHLGPRLDFFEDLGCGPDYL
jgi:hypothetical protein